MKIATAKNYLDGLHTNDPEIVNTAVTGERFQASFFENYQDDNIRRLVKAVIAK